MEYDNAFEKLPPPPPLCKTSLHKFAPESLLPHAKLFEKKVPHTL